MDKFKKSHGMIINTTMSVKEEDFNSNDFVVKNIIEHLVKHRKHITGHDPRRIELFDLCVQTLENESDERVIASGVVLPQHSIKPVRTFFYPSCRIIRIGMSSATRSHRTSVRAISTQEHECGFLMKKGKDEHACLVIKIERMTDVSCFASWSVVR